MADSVGVQIIEFVLRWIHFLSGITWIGILYYFNFLQTPFFGTELGGSAKSAMTRELVPKALWWFRWGAMFTFGSGVLILLMKLGAGNSLDSAYMTRILTGALMGTLMWANVWFVIWPAQQIVIANAETVAGGGEANPAAVGAGGKAGMASRTNTLFSIPMLLFMAAGSHLTALARDADPPADVSVLKATEGEYKLTDTTGVSRVGDLALEPVVTLKAGVICPASSGTHEWGFAPPRATLEEVSALA